MADINQRIQRELAEAEGPDLRTDYDPEQMAPDEPALLEIVELLFFAYRDFTSEPDAILSEFSFGRAHHRVLHFVNRYPGLRVADLLDILKITKQSLGRVLKQLVDEGYIVQRSGQVDRRERLLYPTPQGEELAKRLVGPQIERIARSLDKEDAQAIVTVRDFLYKMISENDQGAVVELLNSAQPGLDRGRNGR